MDFHCNVKIVDVVMGAGKTSAAINYMNSHKDEKFLYITPSREEAELRIFEACKECNFKKPDKDKFGTKVRSVKHLLSKGENISTTHALFYLFDQEMIDICRNQEYTLIMDEVADVVEPYNISKDDLNTLMSEYVDIDEKTCLLKWRESAANYKGKFENEKRLCEMSCLGSYSGTLMIWLFPINIFNAFKNIYILTYIFRAQIQRYYYDYYKLPYTYIYVDKVDGKYQFVDYKPENTKSSYNYKKLIHIHDNQKMNAIGDMTYDLSKTWYLRNANNFVIKKLKNNIYNYFNNIMDSKSTQNLWTTFKDYEKKLSGKGYIKAYIPSNCRATNKYKERFVLVYPINKFMHSYVKQFFQVNGIQVDEDGYALSEMLQWIWRSAIREGNEIWIYIPSVRMRTLLENWIEENSAK